MPGIVHSDGLERHPPAGRLVLALASALVLAGPAVGLTLRLFDADLFYHSAQEDGALEWATFYAFLVAGLVYFSLVRAPHEKDRKLGWFPLALALFCIFVAGEEISWGQRLLGIAPPRFLVEHNLQQELSLHNLAGARWHTLGFAAVALGYGALLPLAARLAVTRRWLGRFGLSVPPAGLAPAFVALLLIHLGARALPFLDEWTELGLGCAMLFAGLLQAPRAQPARTVLVAVAIVLALGAATSTAAAAIRPRSEERSTRALAELEALRTDLRQGELELSCALHKRLRDYQRATGHAALRAGAFARAAAQRGSTLAADQFLDPWSMPYWIVARCPADGSERSVLVYSTGANRRRDSTRWSIDGDDLAVVVLGPVDGQEAPGRD